MKADHPESLDIDGNSFFAAVLQQVIALCGVAERQHGRDPQPDARLAVARCLQAANLRLQSGLPFEPALPQCITLVEVASRVMASFAAAPEAASAASVLLPPICNILMTLIDHVQKCSQKLNTARRSLLASVKLVLEGPQPLLSAACVAACGPVLVGEAAASAYYAINIDCVANAAILDGESGLAAQLLLQCSALLSNPTIASQLMNHHDYPMLSLGTAQQFAVHLECSADDMRNFVFNYMSKLMISAVRMNSRSKLLADNQQQLLALSAAVARAARKYGSKGGLQQSVHLPAAAVYKVVGLLASIADASAEALHHNPLLVCQPAGLAATLASGAVAALAFAAVDSSCGSRPPEIADEMQGCMQYATHAAKYMHVLAQQLLKPSRTNAHAARTALTTQGAA